MGRWSTSLHILRAEHPDPRVVKVRSVFGALPYGFGKNLVETCGEVRDVPEHVLLRLLADSAGRFVHVTGLARGAPVGAKGALLLATFGAIGLGRSKQYNTSQ